MNTLNYKKKTINYNFKQPKKTFTQLFPYKKKTNSNFNKKSSFTQ